MKDSYLLVKSRKSARCPITHLTCNTVFSKLLLLFFLLPIFSFGQSRCVIQVTGQNGISPSVVPFAKVTSQLGDTITDAIGGVTLTEGRYTISHSNYFPLSINIDGSQDTIYIQLRLKRLFAQFDSSGNEGKSIVAKVVNNRFQNNPLRTGHLNSWWSYTRFSFTPENIESLKAKINPTLKLLRLSTIPSANSDHHLLLSEVLAQFDYKDELHQLEHVIASNSFGLDRDELLAPAFVQNTVSPYAQLLYINGSYFINPFDSKGCRFYQFRVSDSLKTSNGEKWKALDFFPVHRGIRRLVKGQVWINTQTYGIESLHAEAATRMDGRISIDIRCVRSAIAKIYLLKERRVRDYISSFGQFVEQQARTIYLPRPYQPSKFDEVVYVFDTVGQKANRYLIDSLRPYPLTAKDKATIDFFTKNGDLVNADRYLNLVERLYFGQIPLGNWVNFELRKLLSFSAYEVLRVGVGFITSDRLSERWQAKGYLGFGLADARFKGGFGFNWQPLEQYSGRLFFDYANDVREPGVQNFAFDKSMYSQESLRRLQLPDVDYYSKVVLGWRGMLAKNVYTECGVRNTHLQPNYQYAFQSNDGSITKGSFRVSEQYVAVRISYGEQFAKIRNIRFSLGSLYPEFWLQYSGSANNLVLGGDYNFTKWDFRANFKYYYPFGGYSGVQILGGIANGELPYGFLYNIRGSYRSFSAITYNSFETMRFQEYLADRYLAGFLTHTFPPWEFPGTIFRPKLTLMTNIGSGSLTSSSRHLEISFRPFNKLFMESGAFFTDLVFLEIAGGRLGLGAGGFLRYGPSRRSQLGENLVAKVAVTFNY